MRSRLVLLAAAALLATTGSAAAQDEAPAAPQLTERPSWTATGVRMTLRGPERGLLKAIVERGGERIGEREVSCPEPGTAKTFTVPVPRAERHGRVRITLALWTPAGVRVRKTVVAPRRAP